MNSPTIQVMRLPHNNDLPLPSYPRKGAAGLDLLAAMAGLPEIPGASGQPAGAAILRPGERQAIPTGLVIALPPGFEGQIRPRTGPAYRHGIDVLEGSVDSDYRGEVQVILINHGSEPNVVKHGTPIAVLVVAAVTHAEIREITSFEECAA